MKRLADVMTSRIAQRYSGQHRRWKPLSSLMANEWHPPTCALESLLDPYTFRRAQYITGTVLLAQTSGTPAPTVSDFNKELAHKTGVLCTRLTFR